MMWAVETTLVNAYKKCYRYHEERLLRMPWLHYKFQKEVGCAWISPTTDWSTCNCYRAGSAGCESNKRRIS
eukprot:1815643-Ditylum_brightwellii.AAC.1